MYIIKPSQLDGTIHSFPCWGMGDIVRTPLQLFKGEIDLTKNPKKRGDGKLLKGKGYSVGKGGCC